MARMQYSPQFKTKLVLEVLGGEKELGTIAYENNRSARAWTASPVGRTIS